MKELDILIEDVEFISKYITKDVDEYLQELKKKRAKLKEEKILKGTH